ncbi:MAG: RNB domain-containing ribonuclease [Treponema sp.]|jgi:exoribonuclease-2|nr:RNB domain-containing ribonuclease [Treponema sp.]
MIPEKSLVLYKSRPAVVTGTEGDKINISVLGDDKKAQGCKVREKDVELLHPGPCSFKDLESEAPAGDLRGAWELLAADREDSGGAVSLKELAELAWGGFSPSAALAAWEALREGLYFAGDPASIRIKSAEEVEEAEKQRGRRQKEAEERSAFLGRLKALPAGKDAALVETDRRYLQEVEALAWGRTDKSRTLRELGRPETPQEAHRVLLAAGAWTPWENPHPRRFGLSLASAAINPGPPPPEDRADLTHLTSYAIDSPWSGDPDDAVSLEGPDSQGRLVLWVHVADPAASILPGTPCDREARDRGATLYVPEGSSRMLAPESLDFFALGLQADGLSPALSFKIVLNGDLSIAETAITPSLVRVARLSYEEADRIAQGELAGLFALAERNVERRLNSGAVFIDLPEVHISLKAGREGGEKELAIEPIRPYKSSEMVRECMVLAGEAAALWALRNRAPFPFITQEAGDLPADRLPGLAGAWQMRRCMRPRAVSTKPAVHWGLGLDQYTQVTSPLRRYTDLLCHQQIRAFLKGGALLSEEEVLLRVSAAEAAAVAAVKAERASRAHWTAVYLSDKKGSLWEGVVLDRKGNRGVVVIPALGLETQAGIRAGLEPNDPVELVLKSVNIPEGSALFAES